MGSRVERLDEFVFRAKELCVQSPEEVRYSLKYQGSNGTLVAKATDDKVCLTYKTDQSVDLFGLHSLSEWFYSSCTGVKRPRVESTLSEAQENPEAAKPTDEAGQAAKEQTSNSKTAGKKNKKNKKRR